MSIKRTRTAAVVCFVLALTGFAISTPQWGGIGVAVICGILYSAIFIEARKRREKYGGVLALLPVLIGGKIWEAAMGRGGTEGTVELGRAFQFIGVACCVGLCLTLIARTKSRRSKEVRRNTAS